MGYNKDIYETVSRKLSIIRQESEYKSAQKRELFFIKHPRAKEIEKLLSATAVKVAKEVLRGADAKERLTQLKVSNLKLQTELKEILSSENLPDNYLEVEYQCKMCNDTGYINGKLCECFKQFMKKEVYNRLNALSPLSLSTFDSFSLDYYSAISSKEGATSPQKRMSDIFNYCKKYAENFSNGSKSLLMQGATGLGKTHLSLAIANTVIEKGFGVIYASTQNIIAKLEKERFRYNRNDDTEDTESYLIECDLLILDDLGTEFSTPFSNAAIYNIINSRIMLSKPTIISTNLTTKELEKAYTQRVASRIIGNNIRLAFLGNDVRQKKVQKNSVKTAHK